MGVVSTLAGFQVRRTAAARSVGGSLGEGVARRRLLEDGFPAGIDVALRSEFSSSFWLEPGHCGPGPAFKAYFVTLDFEDLIAREVRVELVLL